MIGWSGVALAHVGAGTGSPGPGHSDCRYFYANQRVHPRFPLKSLAAGLTLRGISLYYSHYDYDEYYYGRRF